MILFSFPLLGDVCTAGPSAGTRASGPGVSDDEAAVRAAGATVPGTRGGAVPGAPWEQFFAELCEWRRVHGHLRVPSWRLATRKLAAWMEAQRQRARQFGLLRVEHERLSALGFDWTPRDARWEEGLDRLQAFHRERGPVQVPDDFPADPELGRLAAHFRKEHREGLLSPEQVRALEAMGFRWSVPQPGNEARWRMRFGQLVKFRERFGHCNIPAKWKEDVALGHWAHVQRAFKRKGKLSAARMERLEGIGFQWQGDDGRSVAREEYLAKKLAALEEFRMQHGHLEVPREYAADARLGKWVASQREAYHAGTMKPGRRELLEAVGFVWSNTRRGDAERWEARYAQLVEYRERCGDCDVSAHWKEDPAFGQWVDTQRRWIRSGQLSLERTARLEALGLAWKLQRRVDPSKWTDWDEMFAHLRAFHAAHGHTEVSPSHPEPAGLGKWVQRHRTLMRTGELRAERRAQLEAIGFALHGNRRADGERWERRFAQLAAYRERFGHCRVSKQWKEDPAFGHWVDNQRMWKRRGKISPERIARLETLGFRW